MLLLLPGIPFPDPNDVFNCEKPATREKKKSFISSLRLRLHIYWHIIDFKWRKHQHRSIYRQQQHNNFYWMSISMKIDLLSLSFAKAAVKDHLNCFSINLRHKNERWSKKVTGWLSISSIRHHQLFNLVITAEK